MGRSMSCMASLGLFVVPILDYDDDIAAAGSGSTNNAMGTTPNVSGAATFAVVDKP